MFHVALERAADQIAGAKPNRQREGQDDASEEDAEGQLDNVSAHLKMIEHHGRGEHQHQPLDAQREKARILQLRIHGADQDRPRQEARDQNTRDQQQPRAHRMREIGQEHNRKSCAGGVRSIESRDADDEPEQHARPERDARNNFSGRAGRSPIAAAFACQAPVELEPSKAAPQQSRR